MTPTDVPAQPTHPVLLRLNLPQLWTFVATTADTTVLVIQADNIRIEVRPSDSGPYTSDVIAAQLLGIRVRSFTAQLGSPNLSRPASSSTPAGPPTQSAHAVLLRLGVQQLRTFIDTIDDTTALVIEADDIRIELHPSHDKAHPSDILAAQLLDTGVQWFTEQLTANTPQA